MPVSRTYSIRRSRFWFTFGSSLGNLPRRRSRHRERAYRMVVGGRIRARRCTGYRVARKHLIAAVLVGGERTLLKDAAFWDAPVGRHRVEGALARNQRPTLQ
jgi:hypothetical protein